MDLHTTFSILRRKNHKKRISSNSENNLFFTPVLEKIIVILPSERGQIGFSRVQRITYLAENILIKILSLK